MSGKGAHQLTVFYGSLQVFTGFGVAFAASGHDLCIAVLIDLLLIEPRILLIGSLCSILCRSHQQTFPSLIHIICGKKQRGAPVSKCVGIARIGYDLIDQSLSFRSIACRQSPNADVQKIECRSPSFRWIEEAEIVIRAVTRIQRKGGKGLPGGHQIGIVGDAVLIVVGSVAEQSEEFESGIWTGALVVHPA